ncbi:unnamed protein product [Rhizoctonia solani]|uniref:AB hydrolase-1 domain-containing protein n=1 Tax=Rhizoctonia solani TaxID=456999 RepID=A0A8H3DRW0_9AGAM|nr:unnamed protein product [Rhizoctonia solani]
MHISNRKDAVGIGSLIIATLLVSPTQGSYIHETRRVANITWSPCPDSNDTQCAFYEVPMDYTNSGDGETVSIFMRKLSASVPSDQRLGSILVNPGGPGGSGTQWIAEAGEMMSTMIEGRYDLIGFDPRGVNLTGPSTACLDSESKFLAREYRLRILGAPIPHLGGTAERAHVGEIVALQTGQGAACAQNGNHNMLRSVGTVAVAKDMARIVEALGEDGLNYWGYSYGTVLGSTFAALFPDLVNRMVLDGVSNAESYFNDVLQWGRDGMQDGSKVLTGFLSTCAEAGPEYCAFAVPRVGSKRETTESLRERLNSLFAKLSNAPLTVPDSAAGSGIIKASDLQLAFLGTFYTPVVWSDFAQALAQLEQGNGVSLYTMLYSPYSKIIPKPYNQNIFNRSMQEVDTKESLFPILCGDSSPLNVTVDAYMDYIRELGKISPVGEQWALIGGGCFSWPFRARERYTGPWTVEKGLKKTKFPILFISGDADPVTPLASGVKMSSGFGNQSATLLIQHGYGHCSSANPSLCTAKNVRDYFLDGKVPPNGTQCTSEPGYIYPTNATNTTSKRSLNKREQGLIAAMDKMRTIRAKLMPFGF